MENVKKTTTIILLSGKTYTTEHNLEKTAGDNDTDKQSPFIDFNVRKH